MSMAGGALLLLRPQMRFLGVLAWAWCLSLLRRRHYRPLEGLRQIFMQVKASLKVFCLPVLLQLLHITSTINTVTAVTLPFITHILTNIIQRRTLRKNEEISNVTILGRESNRPMKIDHLRRVHNINQQCARLIKVLLRNFMRLGERCLLHCCHGILPWNRRQATPHLAPSHQTLTSPTSGIRRLLD